MSLNIFTKIPEDKEFIVDNEQYFFDSTINCIDVMASDLLRIDSAMYCNSRTYVDRWGDFCPVRFLSTGCKTALNVLYHPDVCFSLIECGSNAVGAICSLRCGNVFVMPGVFFKGLVSVNVILDGIVVSDIDTFLERVQNIFDGGGSDV